tara:strand:+ start:614 stop:1207 length:594 start_codon:yes stop_codon:yes gene_type:complete
MSSIENFDIQKHNDGTKKYIKNLDKSLSSFNYYIKEMRENWNNLSEDDKDKYMLKSKADNQRLAAEKQLILDKSKEEIKKLKIFLSYSGDRVPCVGLDNGFSRYTIVGPIDNIELFTEQEKQKIIAKGVPEKYIGKYKSVGGRKFNWRAARKWNVTVYGGSQNGRSFWGGLRENYQGKAGKFTTYNNYKGETWTENY